MTQTPADRVRTLLLRADNVLKMGHPSGASGPASENELGLRPRETRPGGDPGDRRRRARAALQEAQELTRDPALDPRLAELVARRLAALEDDA